MYFDRRLWIFTEGLRWRIAGAVAIALVSAAIGIARLALLGWLLAKVFQGESAEALALPFALIAGVMVLRGGFEYWRNMLAHKTAALVQLEIRKRIYDKAIELGPAHFGLERTGDIIVSTIDGVEQLETYFGQYLPGVIVAALLPLGIFGFVALLDVPVAALLVAFALITLVAPTLFHAWDSASSLARGRAYGAFAAEFLDSVQGLATLKAFGQSAARARLLAARAHEVFRSTMWVLATNSLSRGITDTGIAVGAAATLALGAYRVTEGAMSLEALLIVLMMGIEVFRPLRELRILLHDGMLGQSAAEKIFAILGAEPLIRDDAQIGDGAPAGLAPSVAFEDVRFTYPGTQQPAHQGLSFAVAAGERVGVVGSSGAGKSTILRLLLRLYDPQDGRITIGGHDLRKLRFDSLRAQLAVVSQDTYLFHGTVEDNLRLGKPEASWDEIEAAVRAANAYDFIARLPEGYRTVIGERGIRLSGGQRQRIAIARALLRDAPILVLDEALSAVDAENEAVIQQALDRLMRGRTTLIFAHRLSSVIDADRILVIEDGRIAESGNHGSLMARKGAYHRLMAEQAHESAPGAPAAPPALARLADGAVARSANIAAPGGADLPGLNHAAQMEPTDAILRAEGLGWGRTFTILMGLMAPWKGKLALTFLLGVLRVCALIGVGVLSALVVARVGAGEAFGGLLIGLAVVAPLAGVLHWLESWIAHDMAFRLLAEMRVALFDKLVKLAPAYLLRRRTGDLMAMATQDVEKIEYFFAHTVAPAFVAVLVPGAVLATLLVYGWPMALALTPFLVVTALAPFFMRQRIDRLGSRAREALAELNAHAVDTIQGLAEIVAFQQAERRGAEFAARIRACQRLRLPFFSDLTIQTATLEMATGLGGLAVIVAGTNLVGAGRLDGGALPLLTLLAMSAFLPVSEIANVGRQLAETLGATRRVYAVHNEPVAVEDGPGVVVAVRPNGRPSGRQAGAAIEVEAVDYSYFGANRPALSQVSFSVPAGGTLALVGPSGAGKTTLAQLMMRFWDPDAGILRMDGEDLRDYRLHELRGRIALVAQDTYLFNESLGENIRIARPTASAAEVQAAVARAALGEFVASLPEGLDTPVGERGMRLSGGQRQRVAIARAFLKDAPILILDEATSHLDAVSEMMVRRALEDLMHDRTTVVIAHRLSTVRSAERIVVLDEGRVIESGKHAELIARGGLYARLVAHQMTGGVRGAAS